ncbi:MAG: NlpC/P60 family protein [Lachnospiraceae bacterium]|nr:NlpC/P60 family protein [Lachnospiraceae bacterium]
MAEPVRAATISDIRKQQQATQQALEEAEGKADALDNEQDAIEVEIGDMDTALVEIMGNITLIEEEITEKEAEIQKAQIAFDEAKASAEAQYEAMKRRIKFMYEKGDVAYVQLFIEAKSLTDMLNKTEYIEKLYEYDRELLCRYQETQQQVAELKESLETEQSELETTRFEYKSEQEQLQVMLDQKKAESANYEALIKEAKNQAAIYTETIRQQNAAIKKIQEEEARKAAEEAKKKAAAAAANNKTSRNTSYATVITNATGSALGKEIASYGCQFIGYPYVAGGTSLTQGADCSGFTYAVYKSFGYTLPRNSTDQRSAGSGVDFSQAQPGDLICYSGHVGMYIGDNKIVHASSAKTGIKITAATYRPIVAVRRIVS